MMNEANLPSGWAITTLENICEIVAGNPAPQGDVYFENGEFNFVRVQDMGRLGDTTYLSETKDRVNTRAIQKLRLFPKGSVLFTKSGASTLNNQRAILGKDSYVVSHIAAAIPDDGISSEWIYFSLVCVDFGDLAHSSVMPSLPLSKIKPIPILVPPTNEQHRIVAKIEELFSELDKGIENLKTAREQLKVYRQALLKHAFEGKLTAQWREERRANSSSTVIPAQAGIQQDKNASCLNPLDSGLRRNDEPLETAAALLARIQTERERRYQQQLQQWQATGGSKPKAPKPLPPLTADELAELPELPEGWAWTHLASVITVLSGHAFKSGDFLAEGVPVVKIANVGYSEFIEKDQEYLAPTFLDSHSDFIVSPDDLLLALTRPITNNTTKVCIYPKEAPLALLNQRVAALKNAEVNASFIYAYFGTSFFKESIRSKFSETLQPNLSPKDLEVCTLPVCSFAEQAQIVLELESRLSEADQLDQTLTASLQQAEALRQSILKKAFSGQLVAQDANDEPAAALLARIKAEKIQHTEKPKKPMSRSKRNE